ncbi:hypothetical protein D6C84_06709 [Aureobasidium pullulans]|uniref:Uncharacterized protein n=1 Tax=Aureobasidium pullulans TaxID=5580 RepID=A0A4S9XR30_AURPU|nr:hypothetical protein D6C84_06709 [Aureobasidium pullulans]
MACQLLTTLLLLAITFTTTLTSTLPQQTSLPLNRTPNPLDTRSNYGWSPAVLLQDSTGICPQYAYINCQSISGPNYCCGANTYCAYGGPENHIGCCADNAVCDGEPVVPYTTVWVPSATATTWWTQSGTTATGLIGPAYTVTTTTTATQYVTGLAPTICSTLFAKGDNLPTTAAAACGLVLVVNDAPGRGVDGMGLAAGLATLNGFAAVLGWMRLV